ncbi:DUF3820 family protein [Glaciecola sp. MH2013]|nr:DUF3820 family protein [Glaciecola sp. MH2013]
MDITQEHQQELITLINTQMPFGKYAGTKLLNLPEPYLVWFHKEGFPQGKLGEQLAAMYEIKLNGLEPILRPLLYENKHKQAFQKPNTVPSEVKQETITSDKLAQMRERDKHRF